MRTPVTFLALAMLVVACGSPESPPPTSTTDGSPVPGGTVVIGLLSDVQSWNPYLADDLLTINLLGLIYPSLAIEQTDYRLHPPSFEPSLARSWSWSDDHLGLTVELDPAASWSDGVPITARDVVFTWQVQMSPEVGWVGAYVKDAIDAVEAVDDDTVKVTFNRRYPYQFMDLNDGPIIPAHVWKSLDFEDWHAADWESLALAGGPFTLKRHTPRQEIVLERNPGYFRPGRPFLDRLVFRISGSDRALVSQLLAGELDFVRSIPPADAPRILQHDELQLVIYEDRSYTHICWNTARDHLTDPRVRRALTMAVNRDTVIDVVYAGYVRPGMGPVLSSFWAFNRELESIPFDPAAARVLLGEAGWRDSDGDGVVDREGAQLTIELLAPSENELRQDIAILVQEDLRTIGVEVEPRFVEWGALSAAMRSGDFDAIVNMWVEPTQIDLAEIWHSPPADQPTFNFGRYANPEVDRLLEEVSEIATFEEQKPLLDRIQELIVADQPYTFLVENVRLTAHNSRIRGARINAATPFFNVDEWTVKVEP
jgi:peptide/nickel transport system substrate-binding protein